MLDYCLDQTVEKTLWEPSTCSRRTVKYLNSNEVIPLVVSFVEHEHISTQSDAGTTVLTAHSASCALALLTDKSSATGI